MRISIDLYEPDVLCICETHLTNLVDDAELFIAGYRFFRYDRDFRPGKDLRGASSATDKCVGLDLGKCVSSDISGGGGCIIYYKEHLNPSIVDSFKVGDCLALKIECDIGNVIIACVYRSPSLSQAQNKHLLGKIKRLSLDCADDELVLVGDLNLADVCWVTGTVGGPTTTKNQVLNVQHDYINLITDLGLSWHITDEITRRRVVSGVLQESTLDQVISSNEAIVNCIKVLAPLGKSDHVSLSVDLNVNSKHNREFTRSTKVLWGKVTEADILDFSKDVKWSSSFVGVDHDVESLWKELHSKLLGVKSRVPSCHVESKRSRKVPWDNSCLKRYRRDKDKFWALFDKEPTHYNLNLALCKQEKYEGKETLAKIKYEKKITANLKNSTKPFFSYLRSKRKVNTTVTSLIREDGSETKGAGEAASELSSFFSSVFEQECYGPLKKECYDKVQGYSEISDLTFSLDDVEKLLKGVRIDKSPGPDGLHPKLLRALAEDPAFVEAVFELFCCCAENKRIPSDWKLANVVALHKKGPRNDPRKYRPVSLTSILSKLYQQLMRKHLLDHVGHLIGSEQHGFCSGRSCTSNLLESLDCILDMVDEGIPVDILMFDFRKAFDTVPHHRLLVKLENFGIVGSTLEIIKDFLSDRSMRVGDSFSELCYILSGVPQGSVLGPLLFLLFINDLPEHIKNKVFLFADDLKMIANALRKDLVDEDLRILEDWEDTWSLRFNSEKCKTLHLARNENPGNEYKIHGDILETIESEKDLGLVVSNTFKWDEQIKSSIAKANKTIAWVSRNIICKDKSVMLLIYKSLIRPHLEYAVQCWAPSPRFGNWGIILELEKVQRKFTRLINDIGTLTYGERLKSLTLTTLAERRMRGDLIEAFKIIRGFVDYGQNLFKLSISGLNILSKITKDTTSDRRDFFSERILKYWNILPKNVKMSESVNCFKANLENYKVRSLANVFHNSTGHFWDVSGHIMDRIENPSYLAGRPAFREYLISNPWIAKRKKINTFQCQ